MTLTLRLLGGLTPVEIARAFLTSESAIQQRIVRAKRTLSEARVPFEVPGPAERAERLGAVLEVIYLIFNEGYAATSGEDWMRPALCEEALRLGRVLAGLAPDDPEVHGLVALMEIQTSRLGARVRGPSGEPILLLDQNRGLGGINSSSAGGSQRSIRAEALGTPPGSYTVAGGDCSLPCAGAGGRGGHGLGDASLRLYEALATLTPSPVVELNRAVAVGMGVRTGSGA